VVTSTVYIVQCYCVLCGVYCGYIKSRYTAMVLYYVVDYCCYSNSRYSTMVLCFVGVYCGYKNIRYSAMLL